MLPVKRILCATDFSEPTDEGVKTAGELAEHFGAEILLVHIVSLVPIVQTPIEEPSPTFNVALYQKELEDTSKIRLQKMAQALISPKVKVRKIVASGFPANEITRIAEEEDASLIIITIHSRSRWRHLLFGSKAARILRKARRPILSIQQLGEKKAE
ncbi:MAG: universal stress protein [Dehalococcoidales bacterium]|jgi:nucleotide-binding universal stress UspA family protein